MADLNLAEVQATQPAPGQVAFWWLGQAGVLLKGARGPVVAIDPYLSNSVLVSHGAQRLVPVPVAPEQLPAEVVLYTHWHPDHLDPETTRPLRDRPAVRLVGPPSCMRRCRAWGIAPERLTALRWDETLELDAGVRVTTVMANHMFPGAFVEDAVGYLIDFDGVRVYHTGDTEYDVRLRPLEKAGIHLMFTCFTGTGYTLDAQEAAWFASRLKPHAVVPIHHGMFDYSQDPAATDDPHALIAVYTRLVDDPKVLLPEVGRCVLFEA